ncbi:hypothetical protein QGP82_21405 [Leptothoe sp. LEGE 181152]|nr:hypothetical protein [Leptothoe sp. LEGE 181152]
MIRKFLLFSLGFFFTILAGCTELQQALDSATIQQPPVQYYLAAEIDTEAHRAITEQAIYQLEEIGNPNDLVRVDYFVEQGVQIIYSSGADKHSLWGLIEGMPTLPNDDDAIRSAMFAAGDLARQNPDISIYAIIVTDGSSNEELITSLASVSKGLSSVQNLHLAVVGISPEHRAEFSKSFSPISGRVQFAGTDEEIASLFRTLGE